MKISELTAALQKASQLVGDVPVILKDIEAGAETEFKDLVSSINLATGEAEPSVTLTHGAPAATPTEPATPVESAPAA